MKVEPTNIAFTYTNHKGETEDRHVEVRGLRFGTLDEYFPGSAAQWYLECIDTDRNAPRSFRLAAMVNVKAP
jgi:predicted DNA-binding transcriptional regulator YafY